MALLHQSMVSKHYKYTFVLNLYCRFGKHVSDGKSEREIDATSLAMMKYQIEVYTGNINGAGTDSNVYVTLFGDKVLFVGYTSTGLTCLQCDSGAQHLSNAGNNFERGHCDSFEINCPELGTDGVNANCHSRHW